MAPAKALCSPPPYILYVWSLIGFLSRWKNQDGQLVLSRNIAKSLQLLGEKSYGNKGSISEPYP